TMASVHSLASVCSPINQSHTACDRIADQLAAHHYDSGLTAARVVALYPGLGWVNQVASGSWDLKMGYQTLWHLPTVTRSKPHIAHGRQHFIIGTTTMIIILRTWTPSCQRLRHRCLYRNGLYAI